jgi:hypothetical protein
MNSATQPPAPNGAGTGAIDIHKPYTPGERIQQLSEVDKDIASLLVHLSSAMRALATPPGTTVAPTTTTTSSSHPAGGGGDNNDDDDVLMKTTEFEAEAEAQPNPEPETDPVTAFQQAQSAFFQTVDRIDKQLTRQILALEEAGIITLRNTTADQQQQGQQGEQAAGSSQQQQQQQLETRRGGDAAAGGGGQVARLEPDGMGRYGNLDVGQLNLASSTVERDMEAELWRRAREELGKIVGEGEAGQGDRMEE